MITLISRGIGAIIVLGLALIGLNTVTRNVRGWKKAYDANT